MSPEPSIHFVIPDTQAAPGTSTEHLAWVGQYLVDQLAGRPNVKVIHLGDHWDMPSLSSYDKGKRAMEGRRYIRDIEFANQAFDILNAPLAAYNKGRRKKWRPELHFLLGNHEDRITRAAEDNAQLDGAVSLDHINADLWGWQVHPFLKPVTLDGVVYAHYFYAPMTGRAYSGGTIENRLKTIGTSFTQGHQQTLMYGVRTLVGTRMQHGLVAGSCYLHDEDYKGPQGQSHWRGIVVCHDVRQGTYDPMFVSLDYLRRRYR